MAETIDSPKLQQFTETWPFKVIGYPDPATGKAHFVSIHGKKETPIPPEKVSTDVLKSLMNDACQRLKVTNNDMEAVITVPAYFNLIQKKVTMEAAKEAGINVKQILSEPVAAALAFQHELVGENRIREGDSVFIFDLGGGTFDVTIMKVKNGNYDVVALGGDTHLGGRDFERVIADIMEERLRKQLGDDEINELMSKPKNRYKLLQAAHDVKEAFGGPTVDDLILSDIHPDADDEELTRAEFEERSQHLQDKIKKCCEDTLRDANINAKDINHILLVGGSSRMNLVTTILRRVFPPEKNLSRTVSEDEAIAIGATIYAAKLLTASDYLPLRNLEIKDALPLSISIKRKENKLEVVLKNNSQLPASKEINWPTEEDNQTSIKIPV